MEDPAPIIYLENTVNILFMKKTIIYLCAFCGLLSLVQPISANEINENADTTNLMQASNMGVILKMDIACNIVRIKVC